jgi:hypothetical protein
MLPETTSTTEQLVRSVGGGELRESKVGEDDIWAGSRGTAERGLHRMQGAARRIPISPAAEPNLMNGTWLVSGPVVDRVSGGT